MLGNHGVYGLPPGRRPNVKPRSAETADAWIPNYHKGGAFAAAGMINVSYSNNRCFHVTELFPFQVMVDIASIYVNVANAGASAVAGVALYDMRLRRLIADCGRASVNATGEKQLVFAPTIIPAGTWLRSMIYVTGLDTAGTMPTFAVWANAAGGGGWSAVDTTIGTPSGNVHTSYPLDDAAWAASGGSPPSDTRWMVGDNNTTSALGPRIWLRLNPEWSNRVEI